MNMPTISVVISMHNQAGQILEAIDSVLKQTYSVKEILVINDGSTDGGDAIVKAASLPKVKVLDRKHQGDSVARNIGIQHAKCEYVAFLDANDIWMPMFLEDMVKLMAKYPQAGLFGSRYQCIEPGNQFSDAHIALNNIDPTGMLMKDYFYVASQGDLPFVLSSVVVNKNLFKHVGGFRAGEVVGADQDFFARVALKADIAYSPNIQVLYFKTSSKQTCENNVPEKECPFSQRLNMLVQNKAVKPSLRHDIERYCAAHLCRIAKLNAMIGRYHVSAEILKDPRCKLTTRQYISAKLMTMIGSFFSLGRTAKAA